MRSWQTIQSQHSKHGKRRRDQNRELERNGYERGPTVKRPPTDIDWIRDRRNPILKVVATHTSENATDEYDHGNSRPAKTKLLRESFNWERRVRVHLPIAFAICG